MMVSSCKSHVEAPLIGVSTACKDSTGLIQVSKYYTDAIYKAGGIPVVLPWTSSAEMASRVVSNLDGVLFTGGEDWAPQWYGEQVLPECGEISAARDTCEMLYLNAARERQLPLFGVCRGEQLLNIALGGTLYQDLPSQHPSCVSHQQKPLPGYVKTHTVYLSEGGLLREVVGCDSLRVNSFHHQAVKDLAPGLTITATSSDGIVEGYENADRTIIGVQFHPEKCIEAGDLQLLPLLQFWVERCR